MTPRAVVLAAGASERMGRPKQLIALHGKPLLQHAIEAARRWEPLVVTSLEVAGLSWLRNDSLQVVINDEPQLGMVHSLMLAHEAIEPDRPILVLLGDKPFVTPEIIARVCENAGDADVCYPARGDRPGHPVYFSAYARRRIPVLPRRGILCGLRDDPALWRVTFECDDEGAYFDIDTIEDLERAQTVA